MTILWSGGQTASGFTVSSKTISGAKVQLKAGSVSSPVVTADADGWAKATVSGLTAGTAYQYQVFADGALVGEGAASTLPSGAASFKFLAAACVRTGTAASDVYNRMSAEGALFFAHMGDWHYQGDNSTSKATWRGRLERPFSNPAYAGLFARTPAYWIWSDHDTGHDNNSGSQPQRAACAAAAQQVVPFRTQNAGSLYYAFTVGRVRFIFTDTRAYRSADTALDGPGKTMLGATQKAWLKSELTRAEPVKVWVMEQAWLYTGSGNDHWSGSFQAEQDELVAFIKQHGVRVYIVHGDSHMLAADDGTHTPGGIPVFCAAPIDGNAASTPGKYSQGKVESPNGGADNHYGVFTVTDDGSHITIVGNGVRSGQSAPAVTMTTVF